MIYLSSLQYMTGVLSNDIFVISTVQDGYLIKCYLCHLYSTGRVSYQIISLSSLQYRTGGHPSCTVEMTNISFDKRPVLYCRDDKDSI
jgi:hypothetical protein